MKRVLPGVILVVLILVLGACGASDPGSHKIIYTLSNIREGPMTLHAMDSDGSDPALIYTYQGADSIGQARLSKDGSVVLLVDANQTDTRTGVLPNFRYDLVTMNADGSNRIVWADDLEATLPCMTFLYAQLSADGSKLAYNLPQGETCGEDIYISGTDQSDPQVLYHNDDGHISFRLTEDGQAVIVIEDGALLRISSQDLVQNTLFSNDELKYLSLVSIDTKSLYFYAITDIEVIQLMKLNLASGQATVLYEGEKPSTMTIASDGGSMLYTYQAFTDEPLMTGCTESDKRVAFGLYDFGSDRITNLDCLSFPSGDYPRFSYDGRFVFAPTLGVTVFDTQGEVVFEAEKGMGGVFSPNSHEFLYWSMSDPDSKCLHKVNLNTGEEVILEASCQVREISPRAVDWR